MSTSREDSNAGTQVQGAPSSGVIFLDKQPGMTSFSALGTVKRASGTRKVGHTGTLDPFATGLLIALVAKATRAARYFNGLSKRYVATVRFGSETDTDDCTGTVIRSGELPTRSAVAEGLRSFEGTIEQLPPSYSAVHVNGRRAHEIAREGEEPAVQSRTVTVHELAARDAVEDANGLRELTLEIVCSAGTYIRSIARDLGRAVGSAAHVVSLRRTGVGPFTLDEAVNPQELDVSRDLHELASVLVRLDGVQSVEVDAPVAARVVHGKRILHSELGAAAEPDRETVVLTHAGATLAVGKWLSGQFAYDMVLSGGGTR